jgi:nucleoside-diphosphate-sugar epimerase
VTCLVLGATGATGRWLVQDLLERGEEVRVVVRAAERLPAAVREHDGLSVTEAAVLDLTDDELAEQVRGCRAVASCLGHTLSLRGLFGPPRRLVTDATRRVCQAIRACAPSEPTRFVLMNTTGCVNQDLDEPLMGKERVALALLRTLLPPHADNEQAVEALRSGVGQNDPHVAWVAVRPDGLVDADAVTPYELHPSPTRSAIFDAGKVSRRNVARFMAELMLDDALWAEWQGRMPVIYSTEEGGAAG